MSHSFSEINQIFNFVHTAEKLKSTMRHGWMTCGRRESVAEHSWRLALFAMLCIPYLDRNVNTEKLIQLAITHDLVEIFSGDIPYFMAPPGSESRARKEKAELDAMESIEAMLPFHLGKELSSLWNEYEQQTTYESNVIKALDKIEAQMQQNEADVSTWLQCELEDAINGQIRNVCSFDESIRILGDKVIAESREIAVKNELLKENQFTFVK